MKFIFIFLMFFSLISSINSQSYKLKISFQDGSTVTFPIENIQKIDFSNITNIEDQKKLIGIIKKFTLLQNYPNPFNPSTTIEYELPKDGNVIVSVYDLNGRLVKNLHDGQQSLGNHKLKWTGNNNASKSVASGLYIYTIKFEDRVLSKK